MMISNRKKKRVKQFKWNPEKLERNNKKTHKTQESKNTTRVDVMAIKWEMYGTSKSYAAGPEPAAIATAAGAIYTTLNN